MPGTAVPDRIQRLQQAAQARHEQTMRRAEAALNSLARRGGPVTIRGVADAARVSRSWIYTQPELRDQIERIQQNRARTGRPRAERGLSSRASEDSLRRRLELAHQRIAQLSGENRELRHSLERAHGQLRAAKAHAHRDDGDRAKP